MLMVRKLSAFAKTANVRIAHTERLNCSPGLYGLRDGPYLHSVAPGGSRNVWNRRTFLEVARGERPPRQPPGGHAPPAERPRPRQRRRGGVPRPCPERVVEGVAVQLGSEAGLGRGARRARRRIRCRRARAAWLARGDRGGDGRGGGPGLAAGALSGAARDERGPGDRDLQGGGSAAR